MREDMEVTEQPSEPDAGSARSLAPVVRPSGPCLPASVEGPLDLAIGAAVTLARPVVAVTIVVGRGVEPLVRGAWSLVARPPLLPDAWTPVEIAQRLADRGRRVRQAGGDDLAVAGGQSLDVIVPAMVAPLLDRIDLTGLVIDRLDLQRLVEAVLDTMDLTQVVLDRVDLKRVVESAIESIDITEIVRTKVDIASLAEQVIDEVNLPEIIRESSTGIASEVIDGARLSAVAGDELIGRWVDRILLRRRARQTDAPGRELREDEEAAAAEAAVVAEAATAVEQQKRDAHD